MSDRMAVHVFVEGTVQGVYFRATTRDRAQEHDVNGWVRNLDDGRVEAYFEGDPDAVEQLVSFCHEGSDRAVVENVEVEQVEPEGYDDFEVRW